MPESSGTVRRMSYASDLNDEQWALLEPVFHAPGKRGPKHGPDLRRVVDRMLYISHTGCQWRFLPRVLRPLDPGVVAVPALITQRHLGSGADRPPSGGAGGGGPGRGDSSMVVIDTHLARGASNGGLTFHDRGGAYGTRAPGAWRRAESSADDEHTEVL